MTHTSIRFNSPHGAVIRLFGGAATAIALMFIMTPGAAAQSVCQTRDKLAEILDGRYSEKPIAAGLESGGRLMEVFAEGDGRTWTVVLTWPGGLSCIVATGVEWYEARSKPTDPET